MIHITHSLSLINGTIVATDVTLVTQGPEPVCLKKEEAQEGVKSKIPQEYIEELVTLKGTRLHEIRLPLCM